MVVVRYVGMRYNLLTAGEGRSAVNGASSPSLRLTLTTRCTTECCSECGSTQDRITICGCCTSPKLRSKKADLKRALNGLMGPHQKLMLGAQLRHVDYLDEEIGRSDEEIKKRMLPFEEDLELLDAIPGVLHNDFIIGMCNIICSHQNDKLVVQRLRRTFWY